ncbi:hypothetical protein BH10PLA2_BH10PLA2_35800 [soil metagenome]
MLYFIIAQLFSLLLDGFLGRSRTDSRKDLEILLLRQQLSILQRHHPTTPRISRWEKLGIAVLAAKIARLGRGSKTKLGEVLRLFKPDTVLGWHRELVRRKWTLAKTQTGGRPATDQKLLALLLRLANENPTWGYGGAKQATRRVAQTRSQHRSFDDQRYIEASAGSASARAGEAWQQLGDVLEPLSRATVCLRLL